MQLSEELLRLRLQTQTQTQSYSLNVNGLLHMLHDFYGG